MSGFIVSNFKFNQNSGKVEVVYTYLRSKSCCDIVNIRIPCISHNIEGIPQRQNVTINVIIPTVFFPR